MNAWPVVLDSANAPTVDFSGPATVTNGLPDAAPSAGYRTITPHDIDGYGAGGGSGSLYDLSIPAAEWYMGQTYPSTNGVLVGFSSGVPYVLAQGQDGQAVLSDGGFPYVDSSITPDFSGDSAGPDGTRLWLDRTFGKR